MLEQKGGHTYVIDCDGKNKIFHINLLKQYFDRPPADNLGTHGPHSTRLFKDANAITIDEGVGEQTPETYPTPKNLHSPTLSGGETYNDVKVNPDLSPQENADILTEVPGKTDLERHHISLTTAEVFRKKPYPCPHALRDVMKNEIDDTESNSIEKCEEEEKE